MKNLEDFLKVHTIVWKNKVIIFIQEKRPLKNLKWRLKLHHEGQFVYADKKFAKKKRWILPLTGSGCWSVYVG